MSWGSWILCRCIWISFSSIRFTVDVNKANWLERRRSDFPGLTFTLHTVMHYCNVRLSTIRTVSTRTFFGYQSICSNFRTNFRTVDAIGASTYPNIAWSLRTVTTARSSFLQWVFSTCTHWWLLNRFMTMKFSKIELPSNRSDIRWNIINSGLTKKKRKI